VRISTRILTHHNRVLVAHHWYVYIYIRNAYNHHWKILLEKEARK